MDLCFLHFGVEDLAQFVFVALGQFGDVQLGFVAGIHAGFVLWVWVCGEEVGLGFLRGARLGCRRGWMEGGKGLCRERLRN